MNTAAFENDLQARIPSGPEAPAAALMVGISRKFGVSLLRQMQEMAALRLGPGKVTFREYYSNCLFDPDLSAKEKREFVGRAVSTQINNRLSPPALTGARALFAEPVKFGALLQRLGLPAPETQAVAVRARRFGDIPALPDPAAVRQFLVQDARYPLVGKSCISTGGTGSVLLLGLEGDRAVLGNGRRIDLDAFCGQVFSDFPEGFVFQSALAQHPDLAAVSGQAIAALRIVTVRDTDTPRVLYSVWKMPAPDVMPEHFSRNGGIIARVDGKGRVSRCRIGTGLDGVWLDTHPVSGRRFDQVRIPHWQQAVDTVNAAHAVFPEFGIVGWDLAITPEGPVIVESIDNPFHILWQFPNACGINNPRFAAVFDQTAAISKAMLDGRHAIYKARRNATRWRRR